MEDTEHYGDRTTAELLLYLPISDGAYTEGILATLDARSREDKAAFEQALRAADSTAQSLWAQHLAAQYKQKEQKGLATPVRFWYTI